MAVPYTFGSATTSIPLSQLDSNFATTITLGNTAVQLGNTITTLTGVSNLASATSLTLGSNGNTTAITVDTSQQVGINRTPSAGGGPLQVGFDSSANAGVRIQTTNASTAGEIINFINSSSTSSGKVIYGASQTSVVYQTTTAGQSTGATLVLNGVAFPATQVASSDANTLDDYEEGTWTPTLGGTSSITFNAALYTKVGNIVYCFFDITVVSLGTGSTYLVYGFPFTCANNDAGSVSYFNQAASNLYWVSLQMNGGGTNTRVVATTSLAASINNSPTVFQNGTRLIGSIVYKI